MCTRSSAKAARAAQAEDEASLLAEALDDGHSNGDDDELDVPLAELWRCLRHGDRSWIRVPVPSRAWRQGQQLAPGAAAAWRCAWTAAPQAMAETYIKATRREGLGLFVRRNTRAGAVVAEFDGELIVESPAVRHRRAASYGTHFLKIPGGVASDSKGTHLDGCQHVARCVATEISLIGMMMMMMMMMMIITPVPVQEREELQPLALC